MGHLLELDSGNFTCIFPIFRTSTLHVLVGLRSGSGHLTMMSAKSLLYTSTVTAGRPFSFYCLNMFFLSSTLFFSPLCLLTCSVIQLWFLPCLPAAALVCHVKWVEEEEEVGSGGPSPPGTPLGSPLFSSLLFSSGKRAGSVMGFFFVFSFLLSFNLGGPWSLCQARCGETPLPQPW